LFTSIRHDCRGGAFRTGNKPDQRWGGYGRGILCLLFPICIAGPVIYVGIINRIQRKMFLTITDRERIPISSYVLHFNLCLVLYVYILFLPPSVVHSHQKEHVLPCIIVASTAGPFLLLWFCPAHKKVWLSRILQWLLVGLVGLLDYGAFYGVGGRLWTIFWGNPGKPIGAIYYFLFMSLIPFSIVLTNIRRHQFHGRAFRFFAPGDITNPCYFAMKISSRSGPVSAYLHDKMQFTTRFVEPKAGHAPLSLQELELMLIGELNTIIRGPCIYDSERYAAVTLRAGTTELRTKVLRGKETGTTKRTNLLEWILKRPCLRWARFRSLRRIRRKRARDSASTEHELLRLNRLLLEDAFPRDILSIQKQDPLSTRGVMELEINTMCFCGMFYFLATTSFGMKVYPYIPVEKGGASYVESPRVKPRLKTSSTGATSTNPDLLVSNTFIMIEQTSTSVFLAATNSAGGPELWQNMYDLPNIIEVSRDVIETMQFQQQVVSNMATKLVSKQTKRGTNGPP
jgi:hypothetical protein